MNRDKTFDWTVHTSRIPGEGISQGDNTSPEINLIVTELSQEGNTKFARTVWSHNLWTKVEGSWWKIAVSVRTVQALVKKWEQDGLVRLTQIGRTDKGNHRIGEFWENFIIKTYREGNKESKRMTPKQVALRVQAKAHESGDLKPPNYRIVVRVLAPILEKQEKTKSIRSPCGRGTRLSLS